MDTDIAGAPGGNSQSLDAALATARDAYIRRNPASQALFERAQSVMPGGNTRTALHFDPFPLYVKSSAGAHIEDVDGHRYLDVLGEYTAGLYGHGDAALIEQTVETARAGVSNGAPGEAEIALAELLCARFPSLDSIRFCNSGTEANLYALTLAQIATGRKSLLAFSGGYHGGVLAFGGGGNAMNAPFDWTVARYNDPDIEAVIDAMGNRLAAVIVEPMLSNGGCITARPEFLHGLRAATARTGAILIFDEVVTSRMGGAGLQGVLGIRPDLTTFGKYIGAGFSFGAFGGRAALMDRFDPRRPGGLGHAGTFNNNVFSMSVGHHGLARIFTPQRADRLYRDGEALRALLNDAAARLAPGVQFTGCGSVMNVHFLTGDIASPDDLARENRELIELFHFDLLEAGIYAARRGQINLSLPMGADDFQAIVSAVAAFLENRRAAIETAMANA